MRTLRTQSNHVFMAIYATFKLECSGIANKLNPVALCRKLASALPMLSFSCSGRLRNISFCFKPEVFLSGVGNYRHRTLFGGDTFTAYEKNLGYFSTR